MCQDTGTAIVMGKKGRARPHRRRRRERARRRHPRRLREEEPALLAARAARHVRREEHRDQPAGADRNLCRGRGRLQIPVRRQGRRLGQQDLPLPGDAVAADARPPARLPQGEDPDARHGGLPALSPGDRHRRHVGGIEPEDSEARLDPLSRRPAALGQRGRACIPRSRDGGGSARDDAGSRRRRAIRRQIFLPRRAG